MIISHGKKVIILASILLVSVAAVLNIKIVRLFQEGNPFPAFPALWGIIKLELTDLTGGFYAKIWT